MSAADPVHPTPPSRVNGADGAAVIDISRRSSAHTTRGRWEKVSHPGRDRHDDHDEPDTGGDPSLAQQRLADHIETTFNAAHLTLTDDDTKDSYLTTLKVVRGILKSAQDRGIIDDTQLRDLDALMAGMTTVPRLV